MAKLWLTSDDIITSVKRNISFPTSQNTFDENDILAFANQELSIGIVPDLMQVHEEYFVQKETVPLEENKTRYPIPERAIGMKMRDMFLVDSVGNLGEMTRIDPGNQAYFQITANSYISVYKYYVEGNEIVLIPNITNPGGTSLLMSYFLRPNQLVTNDRAATVQYFNKTISVDNSQLLAGDTLTIGNIVFTATSGSPTGNEFQIGGTSDITAANLTTAISSDATYSASTSNSDVIVKYFDITTQFISGRAASSNSPGLTLQTTQTIVFDAIPTNIVNDGYVDFLQTKGGHRTKAMDILIPSNGISGMSITFSEGDVPTTLDIGDYICEQYECIIPQIPSDLHNLLVERTCARILESMGDYEGAAKQDAKVSSLEGKQGTLIANRTEGSVKKVFNRHSLLRSGKSRRIGRGIL